MDFADLAIIDLSKAHTAEGRRELAPQLRDALRTNGFVYAVNRGYTLAQVYLIFPFLPITHLADQRDRVFDIADMPFTAVPPEEMKIHTADFDNVGYYVGFKRRGYWASRFSCPIRPFMTLPR